MMNDQGPNWSPNEGPNRDPNRSLTGTLTGALSYSYSVTPDELLVYRLGDTVLMSHSVNLQTDQLVMKATEFSLDFIF